MKEFANCVLAIVLILFCAEVRAQSRTELENKKTRLQKEIEYANKLLKESQVNHKNTIGKLNLINTKITKRQELINTMQRQSLMMEKQIGETQGVVKALEEDLERLKSEYAIMLQYTYRNQKFYDRLMFVFSSKDFNQAYKRLKYFEQYANHRREQARLIEETRKSLSSRAEDLTRKKRDLAAVLEEKEREKITLSEEVDEQGKMMETLRRQEKDLRKDLERKSKEKDRLDKAIARIIDEEIKKAKAKAEKSTGSGTKVSSSGFALTPEEQSLSSSFSDNMGKLPWPSERGVITSTFGEHAHPTLRDIRTFNNGVDIATEGGSKARAIFDGIVSAVIVIPGANKAVMVRHGEYLTVYSNLKDVYVKPQDKVKVKQEIGTVANDPEEDRTLLHLEIWKGTNKQDPAKWIQARK
jgi:septal ring factor EnvC (AmiA/AmiB activator)